jgi:hypothetical protein
MLDAEVHDHLAQIFGLCAHARLGDAKNGQQVLSLMISRHSYNLNTLTQEKLLVSDALQTHSEWLSLSP